MHDQSRPRSSRGVVWTGVGAISYGVLFALSNLFAEYLLPAERSNGEITRLGLFVAYVGGYALGALALVAALRSLGALYRRVGLSRAGSIGLRAAAVGAAAQALFAAIYLATGAANGNGADATFLLFALGFLFLIGGSIAAGVSLVRSGIDRRIGAALLATVPPAIVMIVTPAPVHDAGLFLFAATWVAVGLLLARPLTVQSRGRALGWST